MTNLAPAAETLDRRMALRQARGHSSRAASSTRRVAGRPREGNGARGCLWSRGQARRLLLALKERSLGLRLPAGPQLRFDEGSFNSISTNTASR